MQGSETIHGSNQGARSEENPCQVRDCDCSNYTPPLNDSTYCESCNHEYISHYIADNK